MQREEQGRATGRREMVQRGEQVRGGGMDGRRGEAGGDFSSLAAPLQPMIFSLSELLHRQLSFLFIFLLPNYIFSHMI